MKTLRAIAFALLTGAVFAGATLAPLVAHAGSSLN